MTGKARSEHSFIKVRILILIYVLLCILTILFSRSFFVEAFEGGQMPELLNLVVFFTIPAILLVFLGLSVFNLSIDLIARRPGSKFKARLIAYFTVIALFAAAPAIIVTASSTQEIVRFWQGVNVSAAAQASNSFIMDNYSLHIERFDNIIRQNDFSLFNQSQPAASLPADIAAVQTFVVSGGIWVELGFSGDARYRLAAPPVTEPGHTIRELPRDFGTIRYVQTAIAATGTTAAAAPAPALRFISYRLGDDFDTGMAAIENQIIHLEIIDTLQANVRQLILFYFGVFFFPTVLMTIIIAISFTRRVTHPITELTEATRRVAEGDFSIQILSSPGDELGLLIRSFNAMVRDLDKSRLALLKNEKMSIWQNMAQQLAHEVKNPLTPIRLCAERVLRRFQNEPERTGEIVESSMKAIIHEVEGLSNLLNEFRNMSKPMEPSRSWTALKETVAEIIESLANSYPKIHFDTTHLQEGLSIKIDKHRLSQVITNIVINAIDAMDESGFIEIRCDIVKKRDLSYCRINIKDTGKGISAEDARLIFNPYFTTKTTGTGLGLVVVERIVADHGGSVWFNSELGAGSTFYVDLPLGAAASAGADAVADAGASAGGGAAGAGGGAVGAGGEE